jgi:hypothetical protein
MSGAGTDVEVLAVVLHVSEEEHAGVVHALRWDVVCFYSTYMQGEKNKLEI